MNRRRDRMDWKVFAATFGIVFLAELGDKTQLAALALTGRTGNPVSVFLGASIALVLVTLLGVGVGAALGKLIPQKTMEIASALLFIGVGAFLLAKALWFGPPAD